MAIYAASQKSPKVATGLSGGSTPWVDPVVAQQALNTAQAGVILQRGMAASRGSMGLGNKI